MRARDHPLRPTRRQAIIGGGTLLAATAATAALTQPAGATASVTTRDLSIPDSSYASTTPGPSAVRLRVSGTFAFDVNAAVDQWRVRLQVSTSGSDWELLAADGGQTSKRSATGSYEVQAPLTKHSNLSPSDFEATEGDSTETRVFVRVRFAALDAEDVPLVEAHANDSVTINVTHETIQASASVGGDGSVTFNETR